MLPFLQEANIEGGLRGASIGNASVCHTLRGSIAACVLPLTVKPCLLLLEMVVRHSR